MGGVCCNSNRKPALEGADAPIDQDLKKRLEKADSIRDPLLEDGFEFSGEEVAAKSRKNVLGRQQTSYVSKSKRYASALLQLMTIAYGFYVAYGGGYTLTGGVFMICGLLPSWVYAIDDAIHRRWGRFLFALFGFSLAQKYTCIAASPEVTLLSTALGSIPSLITLTTAEALGMDLLLGGKVPMIPDGFGTIHEWAIFLFIFLTGVSMADAIRECQQASGYSILLSGYSTRAVWAYSSAVNACDAVCVACVIGLVGSLYSHLVSALWVLGFWGFCGFVPAMIDPPEMPTLEPSIPEEGLAYVLHRAATSVLFSISSPLEYVPMLPVSQRKAWLMAAQLRTLSLATTFVICCRDELNIHFGEDLITSTYMVVIGVAVANSFIVSFGFIKDPDFLYASNLSRRHANFDLAAVT